MNTENMSAIEITRRKKVKAVRILSNLTYVDKMTDKEFRAVSEVVGLSLIQVKIAWNNFIYNGYVDGHAKNNHLRQIVIVPEKSEEAANKVRLYKSNSKKVTLNRLSKAIKLYLSGKKPMEIRDITGIGTALLFRAINTLQQTGNIAFSKSSCGNNNPNNIKTKNIFTPLDDMVNVNIVRAIKYAKYKANKDRHVDPCKGLNIIEKNRNLTYYHFLCAKFDVQPIY